jgi:hypothetical protein
VRYTQLLGRRGILVAAIVTFAAGTAAASRWTPWSPLNSCLFCGSSESKAAPDAQRAASSAAVHSTIARDSSSAHTHVLADAPDRLLPLAAGSAGSSARAGSDADDRAGSDEARHDWEPWVTRESAGANNPDSSLMARGFSQLASSTITGGGSVVHRPSSAPSSAQGNNSDPGDQGEDNPPAHDPPENHTSPTPNPTTPTPNHPPTLGPAPLPPAGGGSTPTTAPGPTAAPNPTDPFHSHDTPPPSAFVPPAPHGPLGPNDPAPGGLLPTGSAPEVAPEPGSMLLLATGLAVAFGELRRRRVL